MVDHGVLQRHAVDLAAEVLEITADVWDVPIGRFGGSGTERIVMADVDGLTFDLPAVDFEHLLQNLVLASRKPWKGGRTSNSTHRNVRRGATTVPKIRCTWIVLALRPADRIGRGRSSSPRILPAAELQPYLTSSSGSESVCDARRIIIASWRAWADLKRSFRPRLCSDGAGWDREPACPVLLSALRPERISGFLNQDHCALRFEEFPLPYDSRTLRLPTRVSRTTRWLLAATAIPVEERRRLDHERMTGSINALTAIVRRGEPVRTPGHESPHTQPHPGGCTNEFGLADAARGLGPFGHRG